jgi:processive 1,2-diacylglycerol beta-glucosyltransferase
MKPYRLLILTASTGGGHDARADALAAWAREIYGERVEVKIFKPLEDNSTPVGNFGVELYNFIQRRAPILHHIYFEVIEWIGDWIGNSKGKAFFGRKIYEKVLKDFRPQMIVSLHDFLNKGYFDLAEEMFGDEVRCATYCGEYDGGSGFSRHWVSSKAHRWVGRSEAALTQAFKLGIPSERLERFTFFLPPDEVKPGIPPTRKALRLDQRKITILFANGRNGALDPLKFLKVLEPLKDKVQAIVVCGLNEQMRRAVDDWQLKTKFQMIVEGYSSRMRTYMQLSDVVFFKGGANTATRAFYEACPMWFDGSDGVMPQEQLTIDFFVREGTGEMIKTPEEMLKLVQEEISGAHRTTRMRNKMALLKQKYLDPKPRDFFKKFFAWGFAGGRFEREVLRSDEATKFQESLQESWEDSSVQKNQKAEV